MILYRHVRNSRIYILLLLLLALGLWASLLFPTKARFLPTQNFFGKQSSHKTQQTTQISGTRGYSVKPIAYIFPQFYPIPENDRNHGTNFTEWDNVYKVTHNEFGLETIRPDESVGYYNGLAFSTRQRQGKFLRDSGFYGAVYHHYWFAGLPVLDGVIQAMLKDGEPNTPFMLSWANEPWVSRWDGGTGDTGEITYIPQDYGTPIEWKIHFDWLLPFFRHPQYIRSEGRIQFLVYKPIHMGEVGPLMWAAWRQWALDAGLGGMDIIETRWDAAQWSSGIPDAVNEFQPHAAGFEHQRHPFTQRINKIYHRGTLVCWDTSPRHATDGLAYALPTCHPKTWQYNVVEMLGKIKSDPNPVGVENFFFVNALNEWGEGNVLEPTKQFGEGYKIAMKNAIEISDRTHLWLDQQLEQDLIRTGEVRALMNDSVDVCVIVRTHAGHKDDAIFKLRTMLRSLQDQHNPNWRAVVFQAEETPFTGATASFGDIVYRALDARIKLVTVPTDITSKFTVEDLGYNATDWVIDHLADDHPSCASAQYLLVTDGGSTYTPDSFDAVVNKKGDDLVGLKVESLQSVWQQGQSSAPTWQDRCTWLHTVS